MRSGAVSAPARAPLDSGRGRGAIGSGTTTGAGVEVGRRLDGVVRGERKSRWAARSRARRDGHGAVIVLREAFADLARGDANYRVGIGVVGGRPAEDFNADAALLEVGGIAEEGLLDDVGEERGVALAVGESECARRRSRVVREPEREPGREQRTAVRVPAWIWAPPAFVRLLRFDHGSETHGGRERFCAGETDADKQAGTPDAGFVQL